MVQPTAYTPATDFSDYEASNPGIPHSGTSLDAEFAALNTTLDETLANLALIQRDDGALANQIVTPDSLSTTTRALFLADWNPRGAWVTATAYALKDVVSQGGSTYICIVAHTSGAFATDVTAGKWMILNGSPSTAADIAYDNSGSGFTATDVQDALDEIDTALDAAVAELATLPAAAGANLMFGVNAAGNAWETKASATLTSAGVMQITGLGIGAAPTAGGLDLAQSGSGQAYGLRTAHGSGDLRAYVNSDVPTLDAVAGGALRLAVAGATIGAFASGGLLMSIAGGPQIMNEQATVDNPSLVPHKDYLSSGMGLAAANQPNMIAGGYEVARYDANTNAVTRHRWFAHSTGNPHTMFIEGETNTPFQILMPGTGHFLVMNAAGGNALFRADNNGLGIGKSPSYALDIDLATADLSIVDAGTVGATEAGWVEIKLAGGTSIYLRGYATK